MDPPETSWTLTESICLSQTIPDIQGPSWNLLDHNGPSYTLKDHPGPFWSVLDTPELPWTLLDWTLLDPKDYP